MQEANRILEEALSGLEVTYTIGIAHDDIDLEALFLRRKRLHLKRAGLTGKPGSGCSRSARSVLDRQKSCLQHGKIRNNV